MILDTCALLWLAHDQTKITEAVLEKIDTAPVISISSVTGFEISLKYSAGKLSLPLPAREWIKLILEHHRINIIDLDLDICPRAAELPQIHRDPCDRFIIATALEKNLPVVTADKVFEQYRVEVLL